MMILKKSITIEIRIVYVAAALQKLEPEFARNFTPVME